MIVIREFRKGNRRFEKGEHYTEKDAQKWVDAGFVEDTAKTEIATKTAKKDAK
ncbi:hypothetical protein MMG00_12845 [Ignatzschineria rhizosphaerae]|uniref:Uncharacterized protein n=1 Tax=Ignatzschineria rhizosphaerae TaxID=2923279 RepID=A0ABY3WZK0_9GAMM|nr:hypothetical protein [Ignatzschineria rhizosphaerae]UNM96069.1 hypothetical protein MMG00_12845 [Ignatzschineria rhizosphaerae]